MFVLKSFLPAVVALALLSGCSTKQEVMLAKASPAKILSVAQTPEEGNSREMDAHLAGALTAQGLEVKPALPAGSRKAGEVDAIASYIDVWRWDIAMYMQSLSVKLFDAKTGDLLVTGEWRDSPLHGYRDPKTVMDTLIAEMLLKVRAATSEK